MRKISLFVIDVTNLSTGEVRQVNIPEIDGVRLIRKTDLTNYFNVASSTLDEYVALGKINRYKFNGVIKTHNDKSAVYFNLNEVLAAELPVKIEKRMPSVYNIRLKKKSPKEGEFPGAPMTSRDEITPCYLCEDS